MKMKTFGTVTLACLSLITMACSDDEAASDSSSSVGGSSSSAGGSTSSSAGGSTTDGSGGNTSGTGGGAETGRVRVAHFSPDAPAVDFCVDGGSGFIGPVMESLGASDGLSYPSVTDYVELPAATYSVRLVSPEATDCDTPLGPEDTSGIVLPAGVDATIAALGMLSPADTDADFELGVYVDDNSDPAMGMIKVRFVHASPDTPNVDVGLGSEAGGDFVEVWDNVPYPEVGLVGGEPYLETEPLDGATLSAQANDAGVDALVLEDVSAPAGAIVTAFAIGNLDADPQDLQVVLCVDNAEASCVAVP